MMTVNRVYFAFDYTHDLFRVGRIHKLPNIVSRAAGGFENSRVWQRAKRRGLAEIHGLISDALMKASVTVVCVGHLAAFRTYLDYEVERSLELGNGLVGIMINDLVDEAGSTRKDGAPPPLIEASGYHVYRYRGPERLAIHIEEAHQLAQMGEEERLALWSKTADVPEEEERRAEPRVKLPVAKAWIDGEPYAVKNWNSLGFSVTHYTGPRQEGEKFRITFAAPDAETPLEFDCEANVFLRYEEAQELVCLFVALDGQAKSALARCLGAALVIP